MATKPNKAMRRNSFILGMAGARAQAKARVYLTRNNMNLNGCVDFDAAMEAIIKAMVQMYIGGMQDTFDVEDGNPLSKIEEE